MVNLELSQEYIALVNERFHDTKPETFDEFQAILVKFRDESIDKSVLFSEVKNLFTTHTDLIEKFKDFLDNLDNNRASSSVELTVVEQESEIHRPMAMDKCVDFINKVQSALNDDERLDSFFMMLIGFKEHKDVARVRREVFGLFKEHPELEIEFSMFLAEKIEGRSARDLFVSENRKRKEAKDRTDRAKDRNWSLVELLDFATENGMFKRDRKYLVRLRAKQGAERLIRDNGGKPVNEKIWIPDYFRSLNMKFMRDELKSVERGKASSACKQFVCELESQIANLTKDWDEKKKEYFRMSCERDLQIPVFNWKAEQRTE